MDFVARPSTANCERILSNAQHVLLGVSPFNSCFSDEYVSGLLAWSERRFQQFDVMLGGEQSALQLEALGAATGMARRKARQAVNRNRRSVELAVAGLPAGRRPQVFTVSDFVDHSGYRKQYEDVRLLYGVDGEFRRACLEMSVQALRGRLQTVYRSGASVSEEQAEHAVPYVLAELPFLLDTPAMLDVAESVSGYHRPWALVERIFSEDFPLAISPRQGHVKLTVIAQEATS